MSKIVEKMKVSEENRDELTENLAKEAWETLVLFALQAENNASGRTLVFKGGSALRLLYGSNRMSSDLDFDEPSENRVFEDDDSMVGDTSYGTVSRIKNRLALAEELLSDFGFTDTQFNLVKEGEGTVRFKTSATAKFTDRTALRFVSKIEVSRRPADGLDAVSSLYGREAIQTEMQVIAPEALKEKAPQIKNAFVKTYTPLAIFLMKMQAVSSPSRRSTRDVYDMAYIWSRLGLGDEERRELLAGSIKAFADKGMTVSEKNDFLSLLSEKGQRFIDDINDGSDLWFYGQPDKDEVSMFVLDFVEEFSSVMQSFPEMGFGMSL